MDADTSHEARTSLSRRALLGTAAGAAAVALPIAVHAAGSWSSGDWLSRWGRLACGARVDRRGHVQLTPRKGVESEAAAMLGELAPAGRLQAVAALLLHNEPDDACPARIAVQRIQALDAAYENDAEDPAIEAAYRESWRAAMLRLRLSPARTARGLAAKLREGIESIDTPNGDAIIADALRQLEAWD